MGELATRSREAEAVKDDPQKKTVLALIHDQQRAIGLALPRQMTAERFTRIVLTEVRRNPQLLTCNPMSLLGAIMLAAQLGLEPGPLGHAYLVPFKKEVTFIVGYKGMIDLARRSGQLSTIVARAVHTGDRFDYAYGLDDHLTHVPAAEPGDLTHVYAVAKFKDGGATFVVLTKAEVDGFMARSPSAKAQQSPWKTDYEAMAKKTAIRRLFPFLPVTPEAAQVVTVADEAPVAGLSADMVAALEFDTPEEVVEDAELIEDDTPTEEAS